MDWELFPRRSIEDFQSINFDGTISRQIMIRNHPQMDIIGQYRGCNLDFLFQITIISENAFK
jgi:hypothetical protein